MISIREILEEFDVENVIVDVFLNEDGLDFIIVKPAQEIK